MAPHILTKPPSACTKFDALAKKSPHAFAEISFTASRDLCRTEKIELLPTVSRLYIEHARLHLRTAVYSRSPCQPSHGAAPTHTQVFIYAQGELLARPQASSRASPLSNTTLPGRLDASAARAHFGHIGHTAGHPSRPATQVSFRRWAALADELQRCEPKARLKPVYVPLNQVSVLMCIRWRPSSASGRPTACSPGTSSHVSPLYLDQCAEDAREKRAACNRLLGRLSGELTRVSYEEEGAGGGFVGDGPADGAPATNEAAAVSAPNPTGAAGGGGPPPAGFAWGATF